MSQGPEIVASSFIFWMNKKFCKQNYEDGHYWKLETSDGQNESWTQKFVYFLCIGVEYKLELSSAKCQAQ